MLPEVRAYFDAINAADESEWTRRNQAEQATPLLTWTYDMTDEQREAFNAAEMARTAAITKVTQETRELKAQALEALRASDNPLVKWIASTPELWLANVVDRTTATLRDLPMSREDMDAMAERSNAMRRLVEMADAAGVLPPADPIIELGRPLLQSLVSWYSAYRSDYVRMLKEHLPTILETARAQWEAEQASKQAETVNA